MPHSCRSSGVAPGTDTQRSRLVIGLCALLILAAVAVFQLRERADQSNLAGHADEAAHFVSGICLLDYCRTAFGTNPVSFAESYYVRYPRVAFGHWPPMFYVVQALWYGIWGVTTLNAVLLMGCITATAALMLFLRLQRLFGTWTALLSIGAFLWLPLVSRSELLVMSDMLTGLFMLLAVLAFCDGWTLGAGRYWIQSALWALMAILTKESALALLVFAPLALLVLGGRSFFSRRHLYKMAIGLGLVTALTVVLYAATGVLHLRDYPQTAVTLTSLWRRGPLLGPFFAGASVAIFVTAAYGVVELLAVKRRPASTDQLIHAKVALVWLGVALASQLMAREMVEERYFLPAYFPLILLFAQGLHFLRSATERLTGRRAAGFVAASAWALFGTVSTHGGNLYGRRTGYAEIAAAIPSDSSRPVILVSSDAAGEGAIVAERLIRDAERDGVVLRASKMLSSSDWMGGNLKQKFQSVSQVRELLNAIPVHFVVLDMNGFINPSTRTHHRLLEDTVRSEPAQFRQIGDFPLYYGSHRRDGAVQVFENLEAKPHPGGVIQVDMTNSLGKRIEVRLKRSDRVPPAHPKPPGGLPGWLLALLPSYPAGPDSPHIDPAADLIGPEGGWGRIYVTAPRGHSWQARRLPGWISIVSSGSGNGDGQLLYRVSENDSVEDRWAVISVGDDLFRVMQPCFPYIPLPLVETVDKAVTVPPAEGYSYLPQPSRWRLADSFGRTTSLALTTEGPLGSDSIVLKRQDPPDVDPGTTAVYFDGIDIHPGAGYRLSLWLKTEHPAPVSVRFGQKTPLFNRCGLDQPIDVSSTWRQVTVWFEAKGDGCGLDENRFSIEAGRITGKLWFSQVSLHRESLHGSTAEQAHGEGQPVDQVSPGKLSRFLQQAVKPLQAGSLHP